MIIKKWNYMDGNYSSSNYGAHSIAITIGKLSFYFSYDTIIAFWEGGHGLTISENLWGPTTGKHLNAINNNKDERLDRSSFETKLAKLLKKYKLEI